MTKEQMQETGYHNAFLDCYHFFRRFGGEVTDDGDFWNTVTTESRVISQRYAGTTVGKLVNSMLIAVLDELERKHERA